MFLPSPPHSRFSSYSSLLTHLFTPEQLRQRAKSFLFAKLFTLPYLLRGDYSSRAEEGGREGEEKEGEKEAAESTLAHTRFLEENLNRLFDEKEHEPTKELAIADTLKLLVRDFYQDTDPKTRWHLDLHCAIRGSKHYTFAVSPKTRHPVRSKALVDFLDSAHIEAVLLSNSPSSTFSWYSAENYGAQALTMELGRVARIGENALDRLTAFDLALRNLIAEAQPEHLSKPCIKYRVSRTIVRLHDDFDFMFDDNVENFTSFVHGEVFGHDGDKPLMAKNDNEAIVFPNRHVAIGQRAALMVCEVKTRFEEGELVYD